MRRWETTCEDGYIADAIEERMDDPLHPDCNSPPVRRSPRKVCGKYLAIKVLLCIGFFVLIMFNIISSRFDTKTEKLSFRQYHSTLYQKTQPISGSSSYFGPKRLRPSSELTAPVKANSSNPINTNCTSPSPHNYTSTSEPVIRATDSFVTVNNSEIPQGNSLNGTVNSTTIDLPLLSTNLTFDNLDGTSMASVREKTEVVYNNNINGSSSTGYNQSGEKSTVTSPVQSSTFLNKLMTKLGLNACPPISPYLVGPIDANLTYEPLAGVERWLGPKLKAGGMFTSKDCNAKDRVAIIIPYRNRSEHLPIFLKNLHPMLMRQQINYGIFVVEQTQGDPFNRASLMNVGFLEGNKLGKWDCFIFHDVDLIPLNDKNLYRCPEQPRHMSVAIDVFDYKLPYFTIFGGVSALTKEQFHSVNGFSNFYWGWGGEDDDMSNRIRFLGYHISRYPVNIARYTMLTHAKNKPNPKRYEKLTNGLKRYETDGLNSIKYSVLDAQRLPLYTWLLVQLNPEGS